MTQTAAKVKLYRDSEILRPEFSCQLKNEARKYRLIAKAKSKKEWHFAGIVNAEWKNLDTDIKDEITRDQFNAECSRVINDGLDFPIVTDTGETLRRWCNVADTYENMPGLEAFQAALSFDHFYRARWLANQNLVSVPVFALAKAVEMRYTSEEMILHFKPNEITHDYDKANGYFSGLCNLRFEWIKDKADRDEILVHVKKANEIMEKWK